MREINLTQGKIALVDDEDYDYLSQFKWHAVKQVKKNVTYYKAQTTKRVNGKKIHLSMHRLIMEAKPGQLIDHKDRNPLNNQRGNLRFATYSQNGANKVLPNTSGYRGVHWDERTKKWRGIISSKGKSINLGRHINILDAAKEYNDYAIKLYGEYAVLNKIGDNNVT